VLQTLDRRRPRRNKKRISEAVSHFRRSVEMNPNNYMSHLWLAQGLVLMRVEGDDEGNRKLTGEACEEYRKVLRLNPATLTRRRGWSGLVVRERIEKTEIMQQKGPFWGLFICRNFFQQGLTRLGSCIILNHTNRRYRL